MKTPSPGSPRRIEDSKKQSEKKSKRGNQNDMAEIQQTIKGYYEQLFAKTSDHLEKNGQVSRNI